MSNKKLTLKYRSTINPLAIGINIILYAVLLYLILSKKDNTHPLLTPIMLSLVVVILAVDTLKYVTYKYYFDNKGLTIIHKRKKILLLYKDINYLEIDSHDTHGVIYGYGVRRLLIGTGKNVDEKYLVTPANEKEFIKVLEEKVNKVKKYMR